MDNIIQQIALEIISTNAENMLELFNDHQDISQYIEDTKTMLDEVGIALVKYALETSDEAIKASKERKKAWYVQRKDDPKTLTTLFGDVHYQRTYYKNKYDGRYNYLSDTVLGIKPHDRMDTLLKSKLIEQSLDLSYRKSGKVVAAPNVLVSDQSVMNCIRELGTVEHTAAAIKSNQKAVDFLYIEADEDHVPMQDGTNKEIKLVYVHEGKRQVSKDRNELITTRYFTGEYKQSEDLWLEVADYLEEAYDLAKVQNIFISGDGANWIKQGLGWIKDSTYVLDYFHLSKYIRRATGHMPEKTHELWCCINQLDKDSLKSVFKDILNDTETDTKKQSVKECRRYIINNWEGIKNRYQEGYVGCSAEGHVSHILSDRLSSRPRGWCVVGAEQMARLRVYRANGGNIRDLLRATKRARSKDARIEALDKRVLKRRLRVKVDETFGNITIFNIGRRTGTSTLLKAIRGI